LEYDVAAARSECDLHGVGQGVEAALETAAGVLVKSDDLSHGLVSSLPDVIHSELALADEECQRAVWHSTAGSASRPAASGGGQLRDGARVGHELEPAVTGCEADHRSRVVDEPDRGESICLRPRRV